MFWNHFRVKKQVYFHYCANYPFKMLLISEHQLLSHQNEVCLIGGEHEDGHVLLCQRGDDGLGDFSDAHCL